jgi:beta-lactamase class C
MKRLAIALACVCFVPLASRAADTAGIRDTVDRAVRPLMAQYGIPGMAVGVTVGGETMFFNYGIASEESGTRVDETTLFELGSISKTFTATLACYAQVQGKLSLADHPGRYMAQLKGSEIDRATLLDLGAYTAGGLPLQFPDEVTNEEQMLMYFRQWKPDAVPGTQRRYSNPSIGLLGRTTAIALRSDFSDAVEQQLFPALGLKQSYIRVPAQAMGRYAWGHDKTGQRARASPGVFDAQTYGVKSSTADMIRFVQDNIDPAGLADPFRRAVECTHTGYFQAGDMVQGLGWEQYRAPVALAALLTGNSDQMAWVANPVKRLTPPQAAPSGTLFNKTGSTRGFGTYVAFVPEQKIGVVLLANKNYPNAARIQAAYAILERLGLAKR